MEEIYRVTFVNPTTGEHRVKRVSAPGIIPAICQAIGFDDTGWEITKAEKEN